MIAKKILKVEKLSKIYNDGDSEIVALDNISFDLDKGKDLAIVGPSGSGKTTLLELIGGLNSPSSGSIWIDGIQINKGRDKEISHFRNKTIGFIFQMMYLQDYLTAKENVMIPLITASKSRKAASKRAEELLGTVGLEDRMDHKPSALSGGEMQRVAIARALANSPKVIMADEPTGKLDKKNADRVMDLLDEISKKGVSIIIITHDQTIARRFKNVINLDHGKLVTKKAKLVH